MQTFDSRICSPTELARRCAAWHAAGDRIVFTNGCFDLLHAGHLAALRDSAEQGDRLIVAINSDASVRRLKGPLRPLHPASHRAQLVADLRYVDAVVLFNEPTPEHLVHRCQPDVLCKSEDYRGCSIAGEVFVRLRGGRIHYCPLVSALSTSEIADRLTRTKHEDQGTINHPSPADFGKGICR